MEIRLAGSPKSWEIFVKLMDDQMKISIVTPTLDRPAEIQGLMENLSTASIIPFQWIIVDASEGDATKILLESFQRSLPYEIIYRKNSKGTALQRNVGIDLASGDFIAFIDDDIRLAANFFEEILSEFLKDSEKQVGGITGYIDNQFLDPKKSTRWKIYRGLRLLSTYEPGRYDPETGMLVNRYLQPPHDGIREIDFMGTSCAVWRKEVFLTGLRFSDYFTGYGILEDAHFALRAKKEDWLLQESGRAHCVHRHSPLSRYDARRVSRISTVNHRFVFIDLIRDRTIVQELRFWLVQFVQILILTGYAIYHYSDKNAWLNLIGKVEGVYLAVKLKVKNVR